MTVSTAFSDYRICNQCGRSLPLDDYHLNNYQCKECKRQWAADHYRRQKAAIAAAGTITCCTCRRELPAEAFHLGQHRCKQCKRTANARYWQERRTKLGIQPKLPKPVPAPKPTKAPAVKPAPVCADLPPYPVTRNAGRIPVLYGCQANGDHACYIADGVTTGPTCRHAVDAIAAWNAL